MKKLKKLIAGISAAVICSISVTPLFSNCEGSYVGAARNFYLSSDGYVYVEDRSDGKVYRCEEFPELTDYLTVDSSIILYPNVYYVSTELDKNNNYTIYFFQGGNLNRVPLLATFTFSNYWFNSCEELKSFFEYVSTAYPDITIEAWNTQSQDITNITISDVSEIDQLFKDNNEAIINVSLKYGKDGKSWTGKERFQIMLDIYENTGVHAIMHQAESVPSGSDILLSAGDIDGNGEVTITDAAKIMSYAANPDKYPLSEMSQIVGDVYNTGDGINNMDALQIQKMLVGLE